MKERNKSFKVIETKLNTKEINNKNIVIKFSSRGRLGNEFPIDVLH